VIQKPFDGIVKDDIDALSADEVREGRTLDYKEKLPGNADKDKKEFLGDVSSFANAGGGDMVFGMVERRDGEGKATGLPEVAPGLAGVNADAEVRRLDNMVRDGIRPRVPGVQIRVVEGFRDGPVLVMRTPRSFAAPRMVTFQDHSRFYSRNSGGKYPLDVGEIRTAFAYSETLPERVRRFRQERLGRIVAGETPTGAKDSPKVVLHLLPLRSLDPGSQFDLAAVAAHPERLSPMYSSGWDRRYNFDGFLCHNTRDNVCHSYVQVFRSGAVEAVDARILVNRDGGRLFPAPAVARQLMQAVQSYLDALNAVEADPPVFVMVSLLHVNGYYITGAHEETQEAFDRDALLLPDVLVEELPVDPAWLLRPVFDAIWQASGWSRCHHYDEGGNWVSR
jgi:hypothetical protein